MMMTTDKTTELDETFAAMRAEDVPMSEGLMDRIMLDADMVLASGQPSVSPAPKERSFGALLQDVIGGWPTFSGLAAATVAGLWIGVSPPEALTDLTAGFWGSTIEVPLFESDILAGLEG